MTSGTKVAPFSLKPWFSERVWGKSDLRPWYDETGTNELVGEAWLTGPQCLVETGPFRGQTLASVGEKIGGEFPLLVKILFPADKLSVQVHPDDAQAKAMGETRGKTECWYVLEADPGATVALGLKPGVGAKEVAASVESGTMETLLEHVPVSVGDMLFVDAGTVHAIGPGVVLLETQQTSDVTYRLYDYGRPRELHLEKGLQVIKPKTQAGKVAPRKMEGFTRLIEQRYFVVDRFELGATKEETVSLDGAGCLVGLTGRGVVRTPDGELELIPGKAVVVPIGDLSVVVETNSEVSFARCVAPV
ncbi:type I phosphomannose isomerase catalytic subunit [Tunturiibacter gelidoferens]|uniref:Mannose-6-phosphate isomerase n=1 Tax=Tunturiibacter gelidiferens TaxID=3069689 RepID=A0A9X0U4S1_9BACT|nr:type I phosphomannose isomerase catalytic subunit [Edaphobacter lichenicola]MBB5328117.1 mannose-6-phosphate isomerase [Edaphobacter lichenicola]